MPELPEVETTCCGIKPHILGRTVDSVIVREHRLRWPVPLGLPKILVGLRVQRIYRRAKYLLAETCEGTLIMHLGMSGSLRVLKSRKVPGKHDHVDIVFSDEIILRFTDPRRFGAILWTANNISEHPLLKRLGPEPLGSEFTGRYLYQVAKKRRVAVKNLIMDSHMVAGIGNIYANEALFYSGIRPDRLCQHISAVRYERLAASLKVVLKRAIIQGGTTLKDFVGSHGKPGYFQQELAVYGRKGKPCVQCHQLIKENRLGNRSTCFCSHCQR
ncbi:Formamidopyrimidine-DNA glycosylase [invertebrate metagenome]|uniref:Formamidopyrimidine-DNA glycosylase n=1 Tax=invertebrate metagenome TaxID=1711999 RepID=A0A2H9T629_9ZZZZ